MHTAGVDINRHGVSFAVTVWVFMKTVAKLDVRSGELLRRTARDDEGGGGGREAEVHRDEGGLHLGTGRVWDLCFRNVDECCCDPAEIKQRVFWRGTGLYIYFV